MESKGYLSERMLVILLFLSLCCSVSVSASIPDMIGSWDGISFEMYSEATGYLNSTPYDGTYVIKDQDDRAFAGEESYTENGQLMTEPLAAVFSADGTQFWQDHTEGGLSVGEMVSDKEFYNYMLFPDDGPMVMVSHMVKNGTVPSNWVNVLPNLTGTWDTTLQRLKGDTGTGVYTIDSQQGRIWTGHMEITEENGTLNEMKVVGVVGDNGNIYAVTDGGTFQVGTLTGEDIMHQVTVIPGDDDGTYLSDRWLSRNGASIEKPDVTYPDITGNWTIENRIDVSNATVTDLGASDEWMSYTNQTDQFFTALRHSTGIPAKTEIQGMFYGTDRAFLASAAPTFVVYDFPDEKTIEAIVIRNLEEPAIFCDKLVPK